MNYKRIFETYMPERLQQNVTVGILLRRSRNINDNANTYVLEGPQEKKTEIDKLVSRFGCN